MAKTRPIAVNGNVAYVPLTRGFTAVVDAADVALIERFNWHASVRYRRDGSIRTVYAVRTALGSKQTIQMHREILKPADGLQPDHINGDGLDNRRINLRLATSGQNALNRRNHCDSTSGVKGVCWSKASQKWLAQIMKGGKHFHIGVFDSIDQAAAAYSKANAELHGEFGRIS